MGTPTIEHPTNRPNFSIVHLGEVSIGFSYKTAIALNVGTGWHVSENLWGPTTGKHINWFPARERLDREVFESELARVTS